jgi:hypothetical protein
MSNKNGGRKPPFPTTSVLLVLVDDDAGIEMIAIQLNRRFRLSYVSFQAR